MNRIGHPLLISFSVENQVVIAILGHCCLPQQHQHGTFDEPAEVPLPAKPLLVACHQR
jgi:hypothetical protein